MFDLEKSISEWRKQMLAAGIKSPVPMEELEIHLREEMDRQLRSGVALDEAFACADKAVGPAVALEKEFRKVEELLAVKLVKLVGIAFVGIAGFFSLMIAPQLFHHAAGIVPRFLALAIVTATVLSWRYNYKILPSIGSSWVRAAIGALCCAAAMVWMRCFCIYLLPGIVVGMVGQDQFPGWYFLAFLGAFAIVAILAGVGYGLEKAARGSKPITG